MLSCDEQTTRELVLDMRSKYQPLSQKYSRTEHISEPVHPQKSEHFRTQMAARSSRVSRSPVQTSGACKQSQIQVEEPKNNIIRNL